MRRSIALLFAGIAIAACSDANTDPVASSGKAQHDETALSVSIGGYPHVEGEGTYIYWANVSGGVPPYSYAWFHSYCTNDTYECTDQMPLMNADGDSVPVEIPYFVGKVHLVVNVWDSQGSPVSGAAQYKVANFGNPNGTGGSGFQCDLGENAFPIWDPWATPPDGFGNHYRRNGCTGAREWQPLPPQ